MALGNRPTANGVVGKPFQLTPPPVYGGKAQGDTWSIIGGVLPPGLKLNSTGSISGTPTAAGTYTYTLQAADHSSPPYTASHDYTIVVTN